MIVPKGKTSQSKRDKRRSHDALAAPAQAPCPRCHEPRQPHRVCGNCGFYRDRRVLDTDEE